MKESLADNFNIIWLWSKSNVSKNISLPRMALIFLTKFHNRKNLAQSLSLSSNTQNTSCQTMFQTFFFHNPFINRKNTLRKYETNLIKKIAWKIHSRKKRIVAIIIVHDNSRHYNWVVLAFEYSMGTDRRFRLISMIKSNNVYLCVMFFYEFHLHVETTLISFTSKNPYMSWRIHCIICIWRL